MKQELIVTAKTVEEAVAKAVKELGAPDAAALNYTVLEEPKKGFLGIGATPAKVSVSYERSGADVALALIKNLVENMHLDATVTMRDGEEDTKFISVTGEGAGVLIGHHGDTLDALQYLANLAANKKAAGEKHEYCRVTVDVENYRLKREETLRALARRMADKVIRYKKSQMLEPMNAYERRIIHSEVQKIAGVATNSIGSENNRRVVMYLEEQPTASAKTEEFGEF